MPAPPSRRRSAGPMAAAVVTCPAVAGSSSWARQRAASASIFDVSPYPGSPPATSQTTRRPPPPPPPPTPGGPAPLAVEAHLDPAPGPVLLARALAGRQPVEDELAGGRQL